MTTTMMTRSLFSLFIYLFLLKSSFADDLSSGQKGRQVLLFNSDGDYNDMNNNMNNNRRRRRRSGRRVLYASLTNRFSHSTHDHRARARDDDENNTNSVEDEMRTTIATTTATTPLNDNEKRKHDFKNDCELVIATFYATKPNGFKRKKVEHCAGCHEAPINMMFESARLSQPENITVCTALITDMDTVIDFEKQGMEFVSVFRYANILDRTKIGTGALMVERMKLYRAFVETARDERWEKANIVLVDTDVIFIDSVEALFDEEFMFTSFDYGLSIRDGGDAKVERRVNLLYPVQGGVQFVPKDHYAGASKFLTHVLEKWQIRILKQINGGKRTEGPGFSDDQGAYQRGMNIAADKLTALAKKKKAVKVKVRLKNDEDREEVEVKLIPGTRFNFVPKLENRKSETGLWARKNKIAILHYKGDRKKSMKLPYDALRNEVRKGEGIENLQKFLF